MGLSFLKKTFSLVLSLFLIACLISSAALSGIRVSSAASPNDGQGNSAGDFLYTVSANPPLLKIEEDKQGSFNIKVARGSDKGIFTVVLSLATNSPFLKAKQMMFSPPVLNFEQGQTFKNSTLILGDLPPATYKFKVKASAASRTGVDQASSEVLTLVVVPKSNPNSNSIASSDSGSKTSSKTSGQQPTNDESSNQNQNQNVLPTPLTAQQPSQPPVAKAGSDQQVEEGNTVELSCELQVQTLIREMSFPSHGTSYLPRNPSSRLIKIHQIHPKPLFRPQL